MAFAVIAFDGPDPSRRAAARDRHIASIAAMARDGTLLLGLPVHSAEGRSRGSLMVIAAQDQAGVEAYLAREPFATDGVWQEIACLPLRIPALPWRPWPADDTPVPPGRGHTILIVAGQADVDRFGPMAQAGMLTFAAETLDAPGAILVTTHRDDASALDWVAADPDLCRATVALHASLLRPLPYRPLPRTG
ncbi:YciI family protein [Roseomonas sp. CAU 1739]|uniref:YciI family protein n=1 Tax=Roseomonas sp. CAU 1739 TaxID=3140364 RepID=UPI00325AB275